MSVNPGFVFQCEEAGLAPYSIDIVCAAVEVVESGDYALPISQEEAENIFVHPDPHGVMDVLFAYPDFLVVVSKYLKDKGLNVQS